MVKLYCKALAEETTLYNSAARMEEQEDGAQIARVEWIAQLSVSENVLFAKALDIKQLSAETEMIQDHLM